MAENSIVVRVRGDVRPLIGIGAQIEDFREPQVGEGYPEEQLAIGPLLHERRW